MNSVAELKILILRQQELAAKLVRTDRRMHGARAARGKLLSLLNQLDLAHDAAGTNGPANM